MSRQTCDYCTKPAVTSASFVFGVKFYCADHAPADAVVRP